MPKWREQRPAVIEVIALHHLLVQALRVPLLHIGRVHFVAVADVVFKLQHHLPPHLAVDERFDVAASAAMRGVRSRREISSRSPLSGLLQTTGMSQRYSSA